MVPARRTMLRSLTPAVPEVLGSFPAPAVAACWCASRASRCAAGRGLACVGVVAAILEGDQRGQTLPDVGCRVAEWGGVVYCEDLSGASQWGFVGKRWFEARRDEETGRTETDP